MGNTRRRSEQRAGPFDQQPWPTTSVTFRNRFAVQRSANHTSAAGRRATDSTQMPAA